MHDIFRFLVLLVLRVAHAALKNSHKHQFFALEQTIYKLSQLLDMSEEEDAPWQAHCNELWRHPGLTLYTRGEGYLSQELSLSAGRPASPRLK